MLLTYSEDLSLRILDLRILLGKNFSKGKRVKHNYLNGELSEKTVSDHGDHYSNPFKSVLVGC